MAYVAIVKAFDRELCSQWHSGSCTYFKTKLNCETREEGEAFTKDIIENYYQNKTEQYHFTQLVLEYKDEEAEAVTKMFKYM